MMRSARKGPPAWFIFLLGTAFVFGVYFLWNRAADFVSGGALDFLSPTPTLTVTVSNIDTLLSDPFSEIVSPVEGTLAFTPSPRCLDFEVIVDSAIVRQSPVLGAGIVTSFARGEVVCILEHDAERGWYHIDVNARTRRIEDGYMFEDLLLAINPTPTPTITPTMPPTVTLIPPTATAEISATKADK
ncbi:hypothetical protein MASR2M15_07020 [Anaerolineales bacterium]